MSLTITLFFNSQVMKMENLLFQTGKSGSMKSLSQKEVIFIPSTFHSYHLHFILTLHPYSIIKFSTEDTVAVVIGSYCQAFGVCKLTSSARL